MNLPNKITLFRVILLPFFLVFMLVPEIPANNYIALGIFVVASASDFLDGYLARKYKLVTNFGKFMDPLADKLLVCSALICFVEFQTVPSWIVIIIIAREFIISGFRTIAADSGKVIAANYWGKLKTVTQMIMCCLFIVNLDSSLFNMLEQVFMYAALALTVISLADYVWKNKDVMKDGI